jgi:class I fructose-bisphosphate aldolase
MPAAHFGAAIENGRRLGYSKRPISAVPSLSIKGSSAMKMTPRVRKILSYYESDNPGTKANLARILMQGRLGGSGRLVILPVDQGFEHGPARSFAPNPAAYDPHYHFQLALDAGLSAYASVLGMIEAGADTYAGQIPLILKLNSSNSLATEKDQAITGSVQDALRLGCSAIGFTIYPSADAAFDQMEEIRDLAEEAKDCGLAVVIWSYPRGSISKEGETAIDITAYAAHMAALLGAHIIKVKPPTAHLEQAEAKKVYEKEKIEIGTLAQRVAHVVQSSFAGRRIVVFSGGAAKDLNGIYDEARAIRDGGANGSIIGRNTFQRPRAEALAMLDEIIKIYQDKA